MFPDPAKGVRADVVGKSADWIAQQAGLKVPEKTKILIAPLPGGPSEDKPLSKEKLSPVLAYFIAKDQQQGFAFANKMLEPVSYTHLDVYKRQAPFPATTPCPPPIWW